MPLMSRKFSRRYEVPANGESNMKHIKPFSGSFNMSFLKKSIFALYLFKYTFYLSELFLRSHYNIYMPLLVMNSNIARRIFA